MNQCRLAEIAEVSMGRSFRGGLEHEPPGDVPVIRMQDIDDANLLHPEGLPHIAVTDMTDGQQVREGDVVFRSRGLTNTAALVSADLGPAVLAAPMLLIRVKSSRVEPAYLLWFINHPATQRVLATRAKGTSVQMISKAALQNLTMPVPSLATQRHMVAVAHLAERERTIRVQVAAMREGIADSVLMRVATGIAASAPRKSNP